MKVLDPVLIGVGNPFRGDDGLALVLVRCMRGEIPPGIHVLEETGDGAELLEAWRGADCLVLIDAVQSGSPPGTIHRFDARKERLPSWFSSVSTHSFGVAEAIELARMMGDLPGQLIVYGIEGLDFSPGTELSPGVVEAMPAAAQLILGELRQLATVTPGSRLPG
jgi:hydrogenase maturation protease